MPSGPGSPLRPRAPHTVEAHPYIAAALKAGFEKPFAWAGLESRERARLCKQGLFNAAKGQKPPVSVSVDIEPEPGGTWRCTFVLHDKTVAKAYVMSKYGKDRTQWPYRAR